MNVHIQYCIHARKNEMFKITIADKADISCSKELKKKSYFVDSKVLQLQLIPLEIVKIQVICETWIFIFLQPASQNKISALGLNL